MNDSTLTFNNGKGLNPNIEIIFYLILVGVAAIFIGAPGLFKLTGLLFLPIGLLPFFTKWGTQIELISKNYRHFRSYYGVPFGEWKTYEPYSAIVIQTNHYSGLAQSRGGVTTSIEDKKIEVYFMTIDHRYKTLVAVAKNMQEAVTIAKKLSLHTNYSIEKFSPKRLSSRRR